jgi:hypothetical protein
MTIAVVAIALVAAICVYAGPRRPLKIIGLVSSAYIFACLALWLFAFVDFEPRQDNCAFGTLTKKDYRGLLKEARWQRWYLWPDLSSGIFFPSDRPLSTPTPGFKSELERQLLSKVTALAGENASSDRQIAAVHAIMRSLKAEYSRSNRVPHIWADREPIKSWTSYSYILPQRRFAPLCLACFFYPHTDISAFFAESEAGLRLDRIVVRDEGSKFALRADQLPAAGCPLPQV